MNKEKVGDIVRSLRVLLALAILAIGVWTVYGADTDVQILFPGAYHGDEIAVDSSGIWWAICTNNEQDILTKVYVKLQAVHDPILDKDESQKTGINVAVIGCEDPIVLIRNIDGASIRYLETADLSIHGDDPSTDCYSLVEATFNGNVFSIREEQRGTTGYHLQLTGNGKSQTIYSVERTDLESQGWKVLWAGDLDMDGLVDFLLEANHHYNVSEIQVFLSSLADKNELVRKVAMFKSTGC